jgi:hypothetical protein
LTTVDWPSVLAGVGEYLERLNDLAKEWSRSHHDDAPADTYAGQSERSPEAASPAASAVTAAQPKADAGESARRDGADAVTSQDKAKAPVQLVNAAENGYSVGFLLAGQTVKLQPGESHEVTESPVTVRFDRGGQIGSATKTLTAGRYEFRLGKNGWDLVAEAQ